MLIEILGYIAFLAVGVVLRLIGGGGSIFTVPILIYLFHLSPLLATSYSLFVVGATSLTGAVSGIKRQEVDLKVVFVFGLTSVLTVFLIRHYLLPRIPGKIALVNFEIPFSTITTLLFAGLMIITSVFMIVKSSRMMNYENNREAKLSLFGIGVGLITGFLGAGGGFLVVPALVQLLRLPMKKAVSTSLFIIALNSVVGFFADVKHLDFNWKLLYSITAFAVAGVWIGGKLSKRIAAVQLRKVFGWLVLVTGIIILVTELTSLSHFSRTSMKIH